MNVVHIYLTGPFSVGMTYQDNLITKSHAKLGYNTTLITSCYAFEGQNIVAVPPCDVILDTNLRLIRVGYFRFLNGFITDKLRYSSKIKHLLHDLKPDIIMLHGFQTLSIVQVCEYKRKNKHVKLVIDSHSELFNSARSFFSRYVLHGFLYKRFVKKGLKYADRIYAINEGAKYFLISVYNVNEKVIDILPLGGELLSDDVYYNERNNLRRKYGIEASDVVFVHSGKLDYAKKTKPLLKAFHMIKNKNVKLFIIGTAPKDIEDTIVEFEKKDKRIHYLGWKTGDELNSFFCAADVYIQPGVPSASLQNAACRRTAIMTFPHEDYVELFGDNCIYISKGTDVVKQAELLCNDSDYLESMKTKSYGVAVEKLDYDRIAERVVIE